MTFVLQKELSKQPWFAEWYEPWRTRMRDDTRMRWLVDARNRIEKEGDLDTASIAPGSVLLTDEERLVSRMEVRPLAGPAEIAETVRIAELPEWIRNHAVIAVERRADRAEGLVTYLLRRDGEHLSWITVFGRDESGVPPLTHESEQSDFGGRPLFSPVLAIWEEWDGAVR